MEVLEIEIQAQDCGVAVDGVKGEKSLQALRNRDVPCVLEVGDLVVARVVVDRLDFDATLTLADILKEVLEAGDMGKTPVLTWHQNIMEMFGM